MELTQLDKQEATKFGTNVLKLISGKIFIQAIALMVMPIVTRMYTPGDFGILKLFTSLTAVIIALSSLRYDFAIMLPKKNEEAINIVALSVLIVGIISSLTMIFVIMFKNNISIALGTPELNFYLWFAPIVIFSGGLLQVFQFWSSRLQQFGRVAFSGVASNISSSAVKLTVGAVGKAGPGGLIGAQIVLSTVGVLILAGKSIFREWSLYKDNITFDTIKHWAKRYKRFPIYSTWSGLFNYGANSLPALLLAYYYSPVVVGFYGLGYKAISAPMAILTGSVARVFYQKAAEEKHESGISHLVEATYRRIVAICLFPIIILMLHGQSLFGFIFGPQWFEAGLYMQFFAPWLFFQAISNPMRNIFNVEEKQLESMSIFFVVFVIKLLVLIAGGIYGYPRFTIILLGLTCTVIYAFITFRAMSIAGVDVSKSIKILLQYLAYCIPLLAITIIFKLYYPRALFFVLIALGCFAYYCYHIFKRDPVLGAIVIEVTKSFLKKSGFKKV